MKTALSASLLSLLFASSLLAALAGQAENAWAAGASFESSLLAVRESLRRPRALARGPADVFQELDACHGLDARFLVQPRLEDVIRMIEPCMDALSYRYGISIRAEAREFEVFRAASAAGDAAGTAREEHGPRAGIAIVLSGMVASTRVIEDIEDSLALREGRLVTYPAALIDRTTLRASSLQPVVESCVRVMVQAEVRNAEGFVQAYGACLRSAEGFSIDSVRSVQVRGRGRALVCSKADRDTLSSMNGKVSVPGPEGAVDIEIRVAPHPVSPR